VHQQIECKQAVSLPFGSICVLPAVETREGGIFQILTVLEFLFECISAV
jgi:hypothetical protein